MADDSYPSVLSETLSSWGILVALSTRSCTLSRHPEGLGLIRQHIFPTLVFLRHKETADRPSWINTP